MAQIINTNVASLNTQRNLNNSQSALAVSLQRLSSGLRINSARDDAAGLAISERFTAQIRGLNQAARNANDGVSLAQTAEGDLAQITNNLQRIRELAVQSANATNSSSDRAALQLEATQLIAEIERVASTSAFNSVNLLDGNFASQQFQVGANAGETVTITSISSARTSAIGQQLTATQAGGALTGALTAGQLTINTIDVGAVTQDAALIAAAITNTGSDITATATNAQTAITYNSVVGTVAATLTPATSALGAFTEGADGDTTNSYVTTFTAGATTLVVTSDSVTTGGTGGRDAFVAALVTAGFVDTGGTGTVSGFNLNIGAAASITAAITAGSLSVERADGVNFSTGVVISGYASNDPGFANTATTTDGVLAATVAGPNYSLSLDGTALDFTTVGSDGTVTGAETATLINALAGYTASYTGTSLSIAKADGSNIVLIEGGTDSDVTEGLAGDGSAAAVTETYYGTISVTSVNNDLVIGGTAAGNAGFTPTTVTAALAGVTIANTTLATVADANAAISSVDAALTAINNSRASLGAIQNRFDSIVSSILTSVENLSAARSRIRDADFAEETATLTRNQILQQAGVSILAQANALPQLALSLLQ